MLQDNMGKKIWEDNIARCYGQVIWEDNNAR